MRKLFLSLAIVGVFITAYGCSRNCKDQCNNACNQIAQLIGWLVVKDCDVCKIEFFLERQGQPEICNANIGVLVKSGTQTFFQDPLNGTGNPDPQPMTQVGPNAFKRTVDLQPCISNGQINDANFMAALQTDSRISASWCEKNCSLDPNKGNIVTLDLLSIQQATSWHFRKTDCVLEIHLDAGKNGVTAWKCLFCC